MDLCTTEADRARVFGEGARVGDDQYRLVCYFFRNTSSETQCQHFRRIGQGELLRLRKPRALILMIKDKGVKNYNGMAKLTFRPSKKLQGMLQFRVSSSDRQYTLTRVFRLTLMHSAPHEPFQLLTKMVSDSSTT